MKHIDEFEDYECKLKIPFTRDRMQNYPDRYKYGWALRLHGTMCTRIHLDLLSEHFRVHFRKWILLDPNTFRSRVNGWIGSKCVRIGNEVEVLLELRQ